MPSDPTRSIRFRRRNAADEVVDRGPRYLPHARPPARPARTPPPAPVGSVVDRFPATDPITISVEEAVIGDDAEKLWEAYRVNFEPLSELAMLQHMFSREEVFEEFANPRIKKIVGWEGAEPVGLGMVTNHLESVPQISPAYLRARYPEHAARDAIWYGILVAVSQQHRGLTLFNRIYLQLWQLAALDGGVLAFDICKFNRDVFGTDDLVQRIASNFPGSSVAMTDQQNWYIAELPRALDG